MVSSSCSVYEYVCWGYVTSSIIAFMHNRFSSGISKVFRWDITTYTCYNEYSILMGLMVNYNFFDFVITFYIMMGENSKVLVSSMAFHVIFA